MKYLDDWAGRSRVDASERGRVSDVVSYEEVRERLINGVRLWRRAPDREAAWRHVKASWPEVMRHGWREDVDGEFDEREAVIEPKRAALTRADLAEMAIVGEWLGFVPERDRRLVTLALAQLAAGHKQVRWDRVRARMGGEEIGKKGLYRRFERALRAIAEGLNGAARAA